MKTTASTSKMDVSVVCGILSLIMALGGILSLAMWSYGIVVAGGTVSFRIPAGTAALISASHIYPIGLLVWPFGFPVGIVAIILGYVSRRKVRDSGGIPKGNGPARGGLIAGYLSLALCFFLFVLSTAEGGLRSHPASNEAAAVVNLYTIWNAEKTYTRSTNGIWGGVADLVTSGLIDARFLGTVSGYKFVIVTSPGGYTAEAHPASMNMGRFGYDVTQDGTIRYSREATFAPTEMRGQPVERQPVGQ